MSFPFLGENQVLDEAARSRQPGSYVQLSDGVTHFEIGGPQAGAPVVLVHGFSVPYFIWDPTFEALVRAGFRVLRYDLFGRGYSDRPHVAYRLDFFVRQLHELVTALDYPAPISLVGLSMGGPIILRFADRFPHQVNSLTLIDPAGFPLEKPWYLKMLMIPGWGELVFGLLGKGILLKSSAADFYKPRELHRFFERYQQQMVYRGFKRALLSTMRADALGDQRELYRRVGATRVPVQLIWGQHDRTVPLACSQEACAALPQAELQVIKDAGHMPHYERPEIVQPLLIRFLQANARCEQRTPEK